MSWALGQASEHEIARRMFEMERYERYGIDTCTLDGEEPTPEEIQITLHIMRDEEIPQDLEERWWRLKK